jgi:formylglycine-generating enzyme required for sulfatase activity
MADVITNTIGMELVLVPAGVFLMGGDPVAEQADENETPRHDVAFDAPFYMGSVTVTQSQWQKVMGHNPSHFIGLDRPVESVSHEEALSFVRRLNRAEGTNVYGLPTEAQWEYAARAGSTAAYCFGSETGMLAGYAWYRANSDGSTQPVGRLTPNDWGLYDMHGNVHEWCADWFDRHYYAASPSLSPLGPKTGVARCLRGGDWGSEEWYCRSAIRSLSSPQRQSPRVGFRVVKRIGAEGPSAKKRPLLSTLFSKRPSGLG